MPMLLSTPEHWFRTKACDIYEFRPGEDQSALPDELKTWLAMTMPERQLQTLGPSEHSGWICGGPTMSVLAMNAAEVNMFQERWEDAAGKSVDPRWQCYQWPFSSWREKFEKIAVGKGRPALDVQYRWLLCDAGLYWLRGHYNDDDGSGNTFPGEPSTDDWWWICRNFPEVLTATANRFSMGYDGLDFAGRRIVTFENYQRDGDDVSYGRVLDDDERQRATAQVRLALGLLPELEVGCGFF